MKSRLSARRLALSLLVALGLAAPAAGTWSIVVVSRETGEVGLASATCLAGTLSESVGVLRVGRGAAATQAAFFDYASQVELMKGIQNGVPPKKLVAQLNELPGAPSYQYGVVTFSGPPASWTGENVCTVPNLTGEVDGLAYAIQGNTLTGPGVVFAAEEALLRTEGDLGQKLMAAMEAARLMGGDSRCSCTTIVCNSCGSPPPDFDPDEDSAACTGFVFVGRVGDKNKPCSSSKGCAAGEYYLRVEQEDFICDGGDAVSALHPKYAAWRASWVGRPDHLLSEVVASGLPLVGDGVTRARVDVRLRDVDGTPIDHGGHDFGLDVEGKRGPRTELDEVVDHGDGTYTLYLTSEKPGSEELQIECDDYAGLQVTFYPLVDMEIVAPGTVSTRALGPASRPGWERRSYSVLGGAAAAGAPYQLHAALGEDPAGGPVLVAQGHLDAEGRGSGVLEVPAGAPLSWVCVRAAAGGPAVTLTRPASGAAASLARPR